MRACFGHVWVLTYSIFEINQMNISVLSYLFVYDIVAEWRSLDSETVQESELLTGDMSKGNRSPVPVIRGASP